MFSPSRSRPTGDALRAYDVQTVWCSTCGVGQWHAERFRQREKIDSFVLSPFMEACSLAVWFHGTEGMIPLRHVHRGGAMQRLLHFEGI